MSRGHEDITRDLPSGPTSAGGLDSGRTGQAPGAAALPVLVPVGEGLEVTFDRYLRLARVAVGAPVARLSLRPGVMAELATAGMAPAATTGAVAGPVDAPWGVCRAVAGTGQALASDDLHLLAGIGRDAAAARAGVRTYAGHPVIAPTGQVLGVLSVADTTARPWSGPALQALADLAGACGAELLLRAQKVSADERTAAAEIGTVRALSAQLDAETSRYLAEASIARARSAQADAETSERVARLLLDQRRTVAHVLQEAMLTRLPQPDHVHLLARYLPAAAGEQVGGDWYDAVLTADGATTIVIGDVTGHDIHAAATMGQLRSALRTLIWAEPHHTPSQVLTRLDASIPALALDASATCLVARVEQPDAHADVGLRRLRWSSAGHLPPVLIHPDHRVELLSTHPDMLLGFKPDTARHDHTLDLAPGTTLLLYTDGLVERRGSHLEDDLDRLLEITARHAHLGLPDLADALVRDLTDHYRDQPDDALRTDGRPGDDTAFLLARLHPEDRPRPAEAGPSTV